MGDFDLSGIAWMFFAGMAAIAAALVMIPVSWFFDISAATSLLVVVLAAAIGFGVAAIRIK